jgi:hypothetical protein
LKEVRQILAKVTFEKLASLGEESYWHQLLGDLDAEIKRLDQAAQPDDKEAVLMQKCD